MDSSNQVVTLSELFSLDTTFVENKMELSVSPLAQKMNLQTPRKSSLSGSRKDLWSAIREGSLADVDSALSLLKKSGGNINLRIAYGLTPLHIAVWRNHIPIVRRLLAAGTDPDARLVSAAKFHSVAISSHGEVYTWGFGRGGRLGHPEFDIHSGQAAVITPRHVLSGLGSRHVKAVAAAKHHTVIATEGGDVYTWGSNREGQLGYTSVDSGYSSNTPQGDFNEGEDCSCFCS